MIQLAHHESRLRIARGESSATHRRGPEYRWANPPPVHAAGFWRWVLTRLNEDEQRVLHEWWLKDAAKHNATAEWARSGSGSLGVTSGAEPTYIPSTHWSVRGAQTREEFEAGIELRRQAAAAKCDSWAKDTAKPRLRAVRPSTGFSPSEEAAILEVLAGVPDLQKGFMEAYGSGKNTWQGEKRAIAWLIQTLGLYSAGLASNS